MTLEVSKKAHQSRRGVRVAPHLAEFLPKDPARLKDFKQHLNVVSAANAAFPGKTANVTGGMRDSDADI